MESKINVRSQIFDLIKKQMIDNNPPETNQTYNRLVNLGLSQFETRQLIGQCIAIELAELLKNKSGFNVSRYIRNLQNLPNEPAIN